MEGRWTRPWTHRWTPALQRMRPQHKTKHNMPEDPSCPQFDNSQQTKRITQFMQHENSLPKTNMAPPENQWLVEMNFPLGACLFAGLWLLVSCWKPLKYRDRSGLLYPPSKLTVCPWKLMFGRNFRGLHGLKYGLICVIAKKVRFKAKVGGFLED